MKTLVKTWRSGPDNLSLRPRDQRLLQDQIILDSISTDLEVLRSFKPLKQTVVDKENNNRRN